MLSRRRLVTTSMLTLALTHCAPGPRRSEAPLATPTPEPALRISGSGSALPLVEKLAEAFGREHASSRFQFDFGTNTGGAIRGLLQRTIDLAIANRPLAEAEAEAGEPLEYHPFARDALGFMLSLPSPVQALSTEQLRDVYGGSLTDWDQIGGPAGPIIVLDRDEDESARRLVLIPFMGSRPVQARTVILSKAPDMVRALDSTPGALGYSPLGLVRTMDAQHVRVLALDGIMPGRASVVQGTYAWHLTLSCIHLRDASLAARRFADFLRTPAARRVMEAYDVAALGA